MARELKASILLESRADTKGFEAFNRSAERSKQAAEKVSANFSRARSVIGQAGFQIQDFAVQVQGGQSALLAFSQQGSQLLGAFGAGGAIAGAVLTVGLLAARLWQTSDAASAASKEVQALADAQERLSNARADYQFNLLAPEAQIDAVRAQIEAGRKDEALLRAQLQALPNFADTARRSVATAAEMGAAHFEGMGSLSVLAVEATNRMSRQQAADSRAALKRQISEIEIARVELQTQLKRIQESITKDAEKGAKEVVDIERKKAASIYEIEKQNWLARSKFAEDARRREMDRQEQERNFVEKLAKDHAEKIDAIENRGRNEFIRRGLQLGAEPNLGTPPEFRNPIPAPLSVIPPSPDVLNPNNAGREDQQVPNLLKSIDQTLKGISQKETALA